MTVQADAPVRTQPAARPLLDGPVFSTLVGLALPNMLAMVSMALVTIAETSYVGALGTPALAGMALVFPVIMLQQQLSGGAIGSAVAGAVSRAGGANDEKQVRAIALQATVIGIGGGLLSTLIALSLGASIYGLLGGKGNVLAEALAYSNIVFLAAIGIWLTNTSSSVLRGIGDVRTPMRVALVVSAVQILVGGTLGLGLGPFPRLGMPGIAAGQVVAYTGSAIFLLWFLARSNGRIRLGRDGFDIAGTSASGILRLGAIAALAPLQSVLTVLIFTRLVADLGPEALAGYGIGARLEFLMIPVAFALGAASVPMVGTAIGAGQVPRARRVAWTAAGIAGLMLGSIGALAALWPDLWTRLFSAEPRVLDAAASYFAWAGPTYAFFGIGLVLYFAAQGAGRGLGPVLAGSLRLVIVAIGGWWLVQAQAPAWALFALIGISMVAFGGAAALAVRLVSWEKRAQ